MSPGLGNQRQPAPEPAILRRNSDSAIFLLVDRGVENIE
jgi:hypothetical protein